MTCCLIDTILLLFVLSEKCQTDNMCTNILNADTRILGVFLYFCTQQGNAALWHRSET